LLKPSVVLQLLKSEWLMASLNSLLLPWFTNLSVGVMLISKLFFLRLAVRMEGKENVKIMGFLLR
jgi:hypothetical protein